MKSLYYRAKHRVLNAVRDFWDRWARGYCCWMPESPDQGGYHFWRCARPRGHKGPHRCVNYLLTEEGSVYSPTNDPIKRLDRYPTRTRRQRRAYDRWFAQAREAQRRRMESA